ncbi:uncharacterized protein ASPGLDRAFT_1070549 [Aspergillus glaucus CBS 516.65]|uniref:Uncharacterized protein n=1 Tax=Aspergillus glaucus CBS 516.65 TaxID=1160497 RepID=A0A1L9V573_ASPGL|nr:hypothetical protein ASPGLDRAFT_1070549 [Aspergillus glaucus CBS 516.65]OJJ79084.1 hypothetical protein ASPGLDRAFT_1070549 [Aspergillus glaucus CBS 516.65]
MCTERRPSEKQQITVEATRLKPQPTPVVPLYVTYCTEFSSGNCQCIRLSSTIFRKGSYLFPGWSTQCSTQLNPIRPIALYLNTILLIKKGSLHFIPWLYYRES